MIRCNIIKKFKEKEFKPKLLIIKDKQASEYKLKILTKLKNHKGLMIVNKNKIFKEDIALMTDIIKLNSLKSSKLDHSGFSTTKSCGCESTTKLNRINFNRIQLKISISDDTIEYQDKESIKIETTNNNKKENQSQKKQNQLRKKNISKSEGISLISPKKRKFKEKELIDKAIISIKNINNENFTPIDNNNPHYGLIIRRILLDAPLISKTNSFSIPVSKSYLPSINETPWKTTKRSQKLINFRKEID